MKTKTILVFIGCLSIFWTECNKEKTSDQTLTPGESIIGQWRFRYGIQRIYDNNNQVTATDTVYFVDLLGQPMTVIEQYTSGFQYFMFRNTTEDTLNKGTFTLQNNILTIHFPTQEYERTISHISPTTLELFHLYQNMIPNKSLTQYYLRSQ